MPLRYVINLILIVAVWFVLNSLIQSGVITNYWSGILITVGINIILATSLNVATGYLGQLPLGHAGFMAVGAYAGGIFMKAMPVQELLKAGNTGAAIPYILLALLISAIVAGIFGIIIGIPALRIICPHFLLAGIGIVLSSVFQALGNGVFSLTVSICRQLVVLIPAAWLLSRTGEVNMVWWAFIIAEVVSLALSLVFMARINRTVIVPLSEKQDAAV
mgnify:CR=1 FL=1